MGAPRTCRWNNRFAAGTSHQNISESLSHSPGPVFRCGFRPHPVTARSRHDHDRCHEEFSPTKHRVRVKAGAFSLEGRLEDRQKAMQVGKRSGTTKKEVVFSSTAKRLEREDCSSRTVLAGHRGRPSLSAPASSPAPAPVPCSVQSVKQ